jgi:predicted nucleic acid-binding protein
MIVMSDASPLRYLILIGQVDLLPQVLGDIVIPETVYRELTRVKNASERSSVYRDHSNMVGNQT